MDEVRQYRPEGYDRPATRISDEAASEGVMGAIGSAAIIGIVMMVVGIAALVFMVIAIIKANNGEAYRYPVALRLVK